MELCVRLKCIYIGRLNFFSLDAEVAAFNDGRKKPKVRSDRSDLLCEECQSDAIGHAYDFVHEAVLDMCYGDTVSHVCRKCNVRGTRFHR